MSRAAREGARGNRRAPDGLVEVLRLMAVVFFAGLGFELGSAFLGDRAMLGPFSGVALGVILGSGLGYVLGGAFGRSTAGAATRATESLREVSADELVAGAAGLVFGALLGAGIGWPAFLLPGVYLSVPLFVTVVAVLAYLGYQLGVSKRDGMVAMFGGRAGLAPRLPGTSSLPRLIDTSVAIDARILDVVRAGFLHGRMVVCTPVLAELQALADSGDDLRRAKGRRGLEALEALKREPGVELVVHDDDVPAVTEVDAKLVRLSLDQDWALLTLDTNLAKAAALAGVRVLNLHALALALRPPVTAGDEIGLALLRAGKEQGQAVGYLDDGSMVVVERARRFVGTEITVAVTSVVTTANGRLVFARPLVEDAPEPAARRPAAPGDGSPADLARPPAPRR